MIDSYKISGIECDGCGVLLVGNSRSDGIAMNGVGSVSYGTNSVGQCEATLICFASFRYYPVIETGPASNSMSIIADTKNVNPIAYTFTCWNGYYRSLNMPALNQIIYCTEYLSIDGA
jgi:hypothetical protein